MAIQELRLPLPCCSQALGERWCANRSAATAEWLDAQNAGGEAAQVALAALFFYQCPDGDPTALWDWLGDELINDEALSAQGTALKYASAMVAAADAIGVNLCVRWGPGRTQRSTPARRILPRRTGKQALRLWAASCEAPCRCALGRGAAPGLAGRLCSPPSRPVAPCSLVVESPISKGVIYNTAVHVGPSPDTPQGCLPGFQQAVSTCGGVATSPYSPCCAALDALGATCKATLAATNDLIVALPL